MALDFGILCALLEPRSHRVRSFRGAQSFSVSALNAGRQRPPFENDAGTLMLYVLPQFSGISNTILFGAQISPPQHWSLNQAPAVSICSFIYSFREFASDADALDKTRPLGPHSAILVFKLS